VFEALLALMLSDKLGDKVQAMPAAPANGLASRGLARLREG
jgi:hypothetical protein